jgi:hypothetical protein
MRLRASYVGITLLGLLGSDVVAFAVDDSKRLANIQTAEAIELFVACASNYPLLSVKWDDGDIEKAAVASAFLEVPSVTPQVIIDKAKGFHELQIRRLVVPGSTEALRPHGGGGLGPSSQTLTVEPIIAILGVACFGCCESGGVGGHGLFYRKTTRVPEHRIPASGLAVI